MVELSRQTREAIAHIHNLIQPIEDKLKAKYPEAKFLLNDLLQLNVYTNEPTLLAPMEIVEDDLLELEDKQGIQLHICHLPLKDWKE